MELSKRAQEILAAIIREYILTGEAVASKTLVERQGITHSPATVRNVMAELEEHGFLAQPHTSAGRIPTDSGLRFFVDRLMNKHVLTPLEQQEIRRHYKLSDVELQEILREVSRLLSDLSQQCALVVVPRNDASVLRRMEFVYVRHDQLIAVLVMHSGRVQNRLVHSTEHLLPAELEKIHHYLNELCQGKTLTEVRLLVQRELEKAQNSYDQIAAHALLLGAQVVSLPTEDEILVEGQSNLLDHPQVHDPAKIKALLRTIEEKHSVLRLLDETIHGHGVKVFIGAETGQKEMDNYSVVGRAYGDDEPLGALGVIGPSNMDYPRVIPLVDFAANMLSEVFRRK